MKLDLPSPSTGEETGIIICQRPHCQEAKKVEFKSTH